MTDIDQGAPSAPSGPRLTQREVDRLIRRTQVLASGISDMWGTYLTPSNRWAANIKTGEIEYDLGLAALLDEQARDGVAFHEIAHLRYTKAFRLPARLMVDPRDKQWATYLVNLFEDCRIERLMVEEFPGTAPALERLRDAWKHPDVIKTMAMADPHMQFANALYCLIFGLGAQATDPRVLGLIQSFASEALDLTHVAKTSQLVHGLCRDDGIVDAMIELRASAAPPRGLPEDVVEEDTEDIDEGSGGDGLAEDGADAGSEWVPTDPDDPAVGADADAQGDGDGDGDGDDVDSAGGKTLDDDDLKASVPDPDDYDMSGGAAGEAGEAPLPPSPEDLADYADYAEDDGPVGVDDDHLSSAASGGDGAMPPLANAGGLSDAEIASLTPEQRALMSEALGAVARADDVPIPDREVADKIGSRLHGSRKMVDRLNGQAQRILTARNTHEDDAKHNLATHASIDHYWAQADKVGVESDLLRRGLASILNENRFDRWSSVPYESGGRIHVPALARGVKTGRRDVFRRQTRNKNRQYAVALLVDASPSMYGSALAHASLATVQIIQALRRTQGVEFAAYAFGAQCACLKPFDMDMKRREAIVGGLPKLQTLGCGTMLGAAIERVGGELVGGYGDDWRKLVIVVTDGAPSDDPEPIVRTLWRKHDVDFAAVGIKTAGRLARIMPHFVVIDDAYDLAPALTQILRRAIRKG